MNLFPEHEKRALIALIDKAADPDEVMTLEALHGFLYGLAILPETIMPSEWLHIVFGEEMFTVDSLEQSQTLLDPLFETHNRFMNMGKSGLLTFPFDMQKLKPGDLEIIGG